NEDLNTIPEKELDEFIKSSVEDLVPIPSEFEDTSGSESVCILPSCDDFSLIDVPKEKAVTFYNPLFNSNDDFISSDDESLSDEDVSEDNVKIYSNPLFEFDDEYISSDVNPLFVEVLKDIEYKDSYDPNLDESTFLVTPLFDSNKDEYFTPGDDVELLLHHDPSIPKMSVASILEGVEDLVLILSESEDTSGNDSECILPSCDDFSPINIFEEKVVTFSNALFNSNDDFTSNDDESLSDEDVPEDNVKIYSNPLFKFDDEYISSDVNPLLDEVLEDIECKDSYDSNLDESTFLVTPLSDSNGDEYFAPGDDVELLLYYDPMMSIDSILEGIAPDLEASRACSFVHRPLELQSFTNGNPIS
nr:hypothetical protein [Tanacetum cinerariifolium]